MLSNDYKKSECLIKPLYSIKIINIVIYRKMGTIGGYYGTETIQV